MKSLLFVYWFCLLLLGEDNSNVHVSALSTTAPDASSSPSSCNQKVVVSTKKNGGHAKVFTFPEHDAMSGASSQVSSSESRMKMWIPSLLHPQQAIAKLQSAIRSTFLPSGYPARTPPGYLRYSAWSWVQDLSTQLRSVLATQRVLEGVGVGREGATALSALLNYLVRDGCGMLATLLFTSIASSKFRTDIKRWRIFADIMVDIGITLEVAAVVVPQSLFLPMISVGTMCKAMCGVAAGACGGAINLHWARGSDISDINAKFGAQHTVTGALGLIFAAIFAKSVSTVDPLHMWTLYLALTVLHIYANTRCMRLIAFDSFNTSRMNMILQEFWTRLEQQPPPSSTNQRSKDPSVVAISDPNQVASREPLFFLQASKRRGVPIIFGDSFNEFSKRSQKSPAALEQLLQNCRDNYLISSGSTSRGKPCVVVSFRSNITPSQEAKAYFHADLLSRELKSEQYDQADNSNASIQSTLQNSEIAVAFSIDEAWKNFQASCVQSGWDLGKTELRTLGYEVEVES